MAASSDIQLPFVGAGEDFFPHLAEFSVNQASQTGRRLALHHGMTWFARLLSTDKPVYVENWSAERARRYEQATFRYLGVRPETTYTWAHKFRKRRPDLKLAKRAS